MATPTNGNGNLVDEFEEAFQACLNVLTKQEATPSTDKEEIKVEVDNLIQRFIDLGRQMEAFFLQKRFLLSALKPELVYKEDNNELKLELNRKDEVIKRHYEKIDVWKNLLADVQGWAKSPVAQGHTPTGIPNGGSGPAAAIPSAMPPNTAQMGVPGIQSPMQAQMQQAQQLQQAQLQQQHLQQIQQQQQQLQMQQQAQHMQQMQVGNPGPMVSAQQALFMQQGSRGGFSQGPGAVLQGPLAYLEKTTSNIDLVGMGDGRR